MWIAGAGDAGKPPLPGVGGEMASAQRAKFLAPSPRIKIPPRLLQLRAERAAREASRRAAAAAAASRGPAAVESPGGVLASPDAAAAAVTPVGHSPRDSRRADATWSPADPARFDICEAATATLRRRPDEPGETRFASEGKSAKWLLPALEPLAAAVTIIEGGCTTVEVRVCVYPSSSSLPPTTSPQRCRARARLARACRGGGGGDGLVHGESSAQARAHTAVLVRESMMPRV